MDGKRAARITGQARRAPQRRPRVLNIKRVHLEELERQRYLTLARAFCGNSISLNLQEARGFQAAEDGWPKTTCPYKVSKHRVWWQTGYLIGLAAIELGLIPSAPRSLEA
jgi:hypothetical protein